MSGVPDALLGLGSVDYTTDLRAELAEELQIDALLELTLPEGEKGVVGWKGSEATVRLQLVTPTGEILMAGEGTGRARNTLSSPENIARATAERIDRRSGRLIAGALLLLTDLVGLDFEWCALEESNPQPSHVLRSAKRIYGVPEFRFYAIADGIKQLLFSSHRGLGPPTLQPASHFLLLPFET